MEKEKPGKRSPIEIQITMMDGMIIVDGIMSMLKEMTRMWKLIEIEVPMKDCFMRVDGIMLMLEGRKGQEHGECTYEGLFDNGGCYNVDVKGRKGPEHGEGIYEGLFDNGGWYNVDVRKKEGMGTWPAKWDL